MKKYIQYFLMNQNSDTSTSSSNRFNNSNEIVNLDCSHAELAGIVAKHFESKLDATEEEILPSFVEYVLAYSGGNSYEDSKKSNQNHQAHQVIIREKRTRKRTRRADSSDDENNFEVVERENLTPAPTPSNRRTTNNNMNDDDDDDIGNGGSDDLYCLCRKEGYGEMIACDDPHCEIE